MNATIDRINKKTKDALEAISSAPEYQLSPITCCKCGARVVRYFDVKLNQCRDQVGCAARIRAERKKRKENLEK